MHHISRKNGAKQHLRVHPNNLQCTENHYASFGVALFIAASQMKNSARNFSAMGPGAMENVTNKHKKTKGSLSQIDTLHCQRKELEHKGGQRYSNP